MHKSISRNRNEWLKRPKTICPSSVFHLPSIDVATDFDLSNHCSDLINLNFNLIKCGLYRVD